MNLPNETSTDYTLDDSLHEINLEDGIEVEYTNGNIELFDADSVGASEALDGFIYLFKEDPHISIAFLNPSEIRAIRFNNSEEYDNSDDNLRLH